MLEHLCRLCHVLPADADEIGPPPLHPPPSPAAAAGIGSSHRCHHRLRCCRGQALALIRKLTTRICASYCFTYFQTAGRPLVKSPSDNFQDMAGVDLSEVKLGGNNPRIFSYAELYIGTHGFSEDEVLGSGGFGRVYRAVLPSDGTLVAVKYMAGKEEHFARKTFEAELVAVANLRHRNLVRLRGWCVRESDDHDQQQLLLVYDYMPNRSLDRVLFRRTTENNAAAAAGNFVLDWDQRMRIARGLAAALFYLHEQLETQIIHRDVKSSNVMLDSHYNARLGDFGLARWLEHDFVVVETEKAATRFMGNNNNNHHRFRMADTTRIGGTIGYLPPESFQRLYTATAKSDVFGFGIVLLEIASGRRALDLSYPDDQIILLDWIRRLADEGALVQAADRQLPNPDGLMELVLHLGLLCTVHHPKSRPNMRWVLGTLSGDVLGKLPGLPLFKTQPLYYISLSPPSNTATSSSWTPTTTTATTISSTPPPIIGISNPTIYITAATGEGETTVYETSADSTTQGGGTGGGESKTGLGSGSSGGSNGRSRGVDVKPLPPLVEMPREISYKEIASATNNFSEERRVAELDFGTAYHGFLEDGRHIMVKRLGIKTCPALRARFSNELKNLGRLRHRNLVQLRGWCTEQGEMLVVYDFSASRLLSHLLFHHQIRGRGRGRGRRRQSESPTTLQWHDRYNIIKSLASAILYLHEEWDEQVIHRNITSNSIVIDHDMNPRLTSFALAEFLTRNEHDNHHIVMTDKKTSVQGIFGYISPEYMESGKANTEADIYSFGVVMLEMISGRMAVDFRYPEVLLVKRVHEFEEEGTERGALLQLADERLDGEFDAREFSRVATLGLACTRSNPELRPTIRQIVSILDGNDSSFIQGQKKKEKTEEWRETNAVSLALIRGIQALGIL